MTAYASIDDLLALFETTPSLTRQAARLAPLLQTATDELNGELGFDYFRHPDAGTSSWLVDTDGGDLLHVHRGIAELTAIEFTLDRGATWAAYDAGDYRLQSAWDHPEEPPDGEPWFHLQLNSLTYPRFPRGRSTLRLTGARGWPAIPSPLVEGVAERARQLAFADPSYSGFVPSDEEYGRPMATTRWPDVTWKFLQRERQRFMACGM